MLPDYETYEDRESLLGIHKKSEPAWIVIINIWSEEYVRNSPSKHEKQKLSDMIEIVSCEV